MTKKFFVGIKKPFITSFVILLLVPFFFFTSFVSSLYKLNVVTMIFTNLAFVCSLFFFISFHFLGKKRNNSLLEKLAVVGAMIFILFMILLSTISNFTLQKLKNESIEENIKNLSYEEQKEFLLKEFKLEFTFFLISYIIFLIYFSFLSYALFKLKEKLMDYLGFLILAFSWSPLTIIGILLTPLFFSIFYILLLIVLFREAKRYKEV
ncbi:MAG: hypothetical protein QW273_03495 [Candidatus Pacearchaeota archaeon]